MFLYSAVQQTQTQNTTVQAAVVTSLGLIIVALIGVLTAWMTSRYKRNSHETSMSATWSAMVVKDLTNDFTLVLEEKDSVIKELEESLEDCERREGALKRRRRKAAT